MEILIILAIAVGLAIALKRLSTVKGDLKAREKELAECRVRLTASEAEVSSLTQELLTLRPFAGVRDAAEEARRLLA